jgi:hypothetical protein
VCNGAVCFPQRFGGSLNLNVHYRVAVPDGVFTTDKGSDRADFHRLPKPDHTDLDTLAFNTECGPRRGCVAAVFSRMRRSTLATTPRLVRCSTPAWKARSDSGS